jgi:hypothetical protein
MSDGDVSHMVVRIAKNVQIWMSLCASNVPEEKLWNKFRVRCVQIFSEKI